MLNKQFYISHVRGEHEQVFPALICKNVRPGEKPFRLTWFKIVGSPACKGFEAELPYLKPAGHIDFKTSNLSLITKKLNKVFNNHPFLPSTNFNVKINLAIQHK